MKLGKLVDFNPVTKVRRGVQVPFINMATLPTNGKYISKTSNRLFSGSGAKFTNGDTLVARITPCLENGKGAYVSGLEENGFGSTEFIVLRAKNNSDNQFIYYLTRWSKFREYAIQGMSGTSGRQRVSWQTLSDFEFATINKQNRFLIGEVLSRLDDKIELNRQMNETLEQMAQAVFQDWFVDFGPVKRKLKGINDPVAILGGLINDPAKAQEIANLFPDQFADDGLPEGWEVKGLDQVADFLNGLALQKFPALHNDDSLPVIKIAELRNGVSANSGKANKNIPEKFIIDDKDFIFSWSGSLLAKFWTGGKGALNQHLFKVTSTEYPHWFFSQWVYHHLKDFQQIAAAKATTMGHIQRKHLSSALVNCPSHETIKRFGLVLSPITDLIISNNIQNHTLAEMRDLLLPKLMSGEISVDELEKKMGGVL